MPPAYDLSLLQPVNRRNDLPDTARPQNTEIEQPCFPDRRLWLSFAEDAVNCVAKQDLEVVDEAERGHGQNGVPLVEQNGGRMISVATSASEARVARLG